MKNTSIAKLVLGAVALSFPIAALADINNANATLNTGQSINLDNGTINSTGSGDLTFTGSSITYVGSASGGVLPGASGAAAYASLTQAFLATLAALASQTPIPLSSLPVGAILGIGTNGGNSAKLLVTASSSSSISVEYTTYGGTASGGGGGGANPPTINAVVNNYSNTPPGLGNSGIAPSTIAVIYGLNLGGDSPLHVYSSMGSGIPTSANGTSYSITVNGTTVTPGIYYSTATQAAIVIPHNTPLGTGTITATVGGVMSNASQITIVANAPGFDTYYGTPNGLLTATNSAGKAYKYTNAIPVGTTFTLWGSGFGEDQTDSDTVFSSSAYAYASSALQVYIGGVKAKTMYAGFSGFPGLNQINVKVEPGTPTGCWVSVVGVIGGVSSNIGTLPIGTGDCQDSIFGINGSQISSLGGQSTVKTGFVAVGQIVESGQTENFGDASFSKTTGSSYGSSSGLVSIGSCIVGEVNGGGGGGNVSSNGLDAGSSIGLMGPAGSYTLTEQANTVGAYFAQLPSGAISNSGGTFVFTGTGGADVGTFTATVNLPNPLLTWTNQNADATVTLANGIEFDWTGGTPGSYVIMNGNSTNSNTGASASFTCYAPQSALTFTVPSYVTDILPAGTGSLSVENASGFTTFTASFGIDSGIAFGFNSISIDTTFQ